MFFFKFGINTTKLISFTLSSLNLTKEDFNKNLNFTRLGTFLYDSIIPSQLNTVKSIRKIFFSHVNVVENKQNENIQHKYLNAFQCKLWFLELWSKILWQCYLKSLPITRPRESSMSIIILMCTLFTLTTREKVCNDTFVWKLRAEFRIRSRRLFILVLFNLFTVWSYQLTHSIKYNDTHLIQVSLLCVMSVY